MARKQDHENEAYQKDEAQKQHIRWIRGEEKEASTDQKNHRSQKIEEVDRK